MPDLNALAGSPFVAMVLLMIAVIFLWRERMTDRAEHRTDNAKQWETVSDLTGAVRDNVGLTSRALDQLERRG